MDRFKVFTNSILKINRIINQIKSFEMKKYELSNTAVACIYYLYHTPSLTSKELVCLCSEDKAAISRALKSLEEKGYIIFLETDLKKRYNTKVTLTDSGNAIAATLNDKIDHVFEQCGKELDDNERKIFYNSLNKIASSLEEYKSNYEV